MGVNDDFNAQWFLLRIRLSLSLSSIHTFHLEEPRAAFISFSSLLAGLSSFNNDGENCALVEVFRGQEKESGQRIGSDTGTGPPQSDIGGVHTAPHRPGPTDQFTFERRRKLLTKWWNIRRLRRSANFQRELKPPRAQRVPFGSLQREAEDARESAAEQWRGDTCRTQNNRQPIKALITADNNNWDFYPMVELEHYETALAQNEVENFAWWMHLFNFGE